MEISGIRLQMDQGDICNLMKLDIISIYLCFDVLVLIVTGRRPELHRAPLPASAEDSRWHMGIPRITTKQGGLK